jgi:hypothetical protein
VRYEWETLSGGKTTVDAEGNITYADGKPMLNEAGELITPEGTPLFDPTGKLTIQPNLTMPVGSTS